MPFLRERSGSFSYEKIGALIIVLFPLALLIWRALSGGFAAPEPFGIGGGGLGGPPGGGLGGGGALGGDGALAARPLVDVIRFIGDWSIRLLLVTLAVTPARRLFNWPKLLAARRTLGLGAAFYVAMHFTFYLIDIGSVSTAAREIFLRVYLTIGFIALIGLIVLSATSFDAAIRRMGADRWSRLHTLIYLIVALGLLHFFMQQKLDVTEPTLVAGMFLWLMGWRFMQRAQLGTGLLPMLALACGAGIATALMEAGWYLAATGIDPLRVLSANLAFDYSISPAWWVFGLGVGIALVSELVLRLRPLPVRRAARA